MTATHMRLRVVTAGGHVHVGVWTGVPDFTFGKSGDLCFTVEEWPNMRELLQRAGQRVAIEEATDVR